MKMRQVDGIETDQQDVSVTLNYEKAPSMTMIVPLKDKSKGHGSAH